MQRNAAFFACFALAASAGLSWLTAAQTTRIIEERTERTLVTALDEAEQNWASASADGLVVTLEGTANSEKDRFVALEAVIAHVSSARLIDKMTISSQETTEAHEIVLQILRDGEETTLLGSAAKGAAYSRFLRAAAQRGTVAEPNTGMVELLDIDIPEGWENALGIAARAVNLLSDAQIELTPGSLRISGTVPSEEERARILDLLQATPGYANINVELLLSAPLPTISPFRFHLEVSARGHRVRDCAATSAAGRQAIIAALSGRAGDVRCPAAIGAPSEDWTDVVTRGIGALDALEGGTLVIVGTDVLLTSTIGANPDHFEEVASSLGAALPAPYSLQHTLQIALDEDLETAAFVPAQFTALRTDDGAVRMRGDLRDPNMQRTAESYAKAHFGFDSVLDETDTRTDLPPLWYTHVLAGLEALSMLTTGHIEVISDRVSVTGQVQSQRYLEEIRTALRRKLPAQTEVAIDVFVNPEIKKPDVSNERAALCEAKIDTLLSRAQITFPPGETDMDDASLAIIEGIAAVMEECPGARFEVGGHTDSQGRESSNLAISQARAVAVVNALLDLDIRQVFLVAKGYGETAPIAENETEEGRAANRRIEFRLLSKDGALVNPDGPARLEEGQDAPSLTAPADEDAEAAPDRPADEPAKAAPPAEDDAEPAPENSGDTREAAAPSEDRILSGTRNASPAIDLPEELKAIEEEDLTPSPNAVSTAARPRPRALAQEEN